MIVKEVKYKIDALANQVLEMKKTDTGKGASILDLCMYPDLKYPLKFQVPIFEI